MINVWLLTVFLTILSFTLLVSYYFLPGIYTKFRLRSYFSYSKKERKKQNKRDKKIEFPSIQRWFDQINFIFKGSRIPINAKEFILIIFWLNTTIFIILQFFIGWSIAFFITTLINPIYYVILVGLKKRRKKKMEEQVPDVFELISNALKTGYSVVQTIDLVAKEDFQPLSEEFQQVYQAIKFGNSLEVALLDLESRVQIEEVTALVDTINITRETGGNLTTVIDQLLEILQEKRQMKREIKSLTSQGRISAIIVASLPIAIFSILMLVNREYMSVLFTHPVGLFFIGLSLVMQFIGIIIMRRLINLKVR